MKLIFGLGNPEKAYDNTPHNLGFAVVDNLCKEFGGSFKKKKNALIAKIAEKDVILIKPLTYMNLSGDAVRYFVKKLKIPLENILIILDDIDIPAGTIRLKHQGSAGTHNGLRDIVHKLNTQNFSRLRVGVGKPENKDLADFVLSKMTGTLKKETDQGIALATEKAKEFIEEDIKE